MSRSQRLISAFIAFHVLALVICAVPVPDELPPQTPLDRSHLRGLGRIAPLLDKIARFEVSLDGALWHLVKPVRGPFSLYMRATRQTPHWNMFFQPPQGDNYIHVRYYVASRGSSVLSVYKELIFPAHPGGHFRAVRGYVASFRDKAIDNTYQRYYKRFSWESKRKDLMPAAVAAQETVVPVIRAFGRKFASRNLASGERLVRVELWRGLALLPEPGEASDSSTRQAREVALETYDAASAGIVPATFEIPLRATIRDADITWTLLGRVEWQ